MALKNGQSPHCFSSLSSHHLAPDADIVMGMTWQDGGVQEWGFRVICVRYITEREEIKTMIP